MVSVRWLTLEVGVCLSVGLKLEVLLIPTKARVGRLGLPSSVDTEV